MILQESLAYQEPRNSLEVRIARLWEDVLGIPRIGIHDNFFDLGGDSLLSFRIVRSLQEITMERLSVAVVFEFPTVAQLAARLEPRSRIAHAAPLVRIRSGTGNPLCLAHSLSGSVFPYYSLAYHLDGQVGVAGIEAPGLADSSRLFDSIEEMAGAYLAMIEAEGWNAQVIGGYSFGAIVAFEMARQLLSRGGSAPRLVLIAPAYMHTDPSQAVGSPQFIEAAAQRHLSRRKATHGSDPQTDQLLLNAYRSHLKARHAYVARPISCKALILHTDDEGGSEKVGAYWRTMTDGGARATRLAGGHFSLFHPPFVSGLADALSGALQSP